MLEKVANNFYEMPAGTIREQTFCCGSGAGLNAGENMELRMAGGFPRANAVKYVHDKFGVNMLACVCAIDRAAFPASKEYWVPEVDVTGLHELVANALILPGEKEKRNRLARRAVAGNGGVTDEGQEKDSRGTGCFYRRHYFSLLVQHGKKRPPLRSSC